MIYFEKISFKQYCIDCGYTAEFDMQIMEEFEKEFEDIQLPERATKGSAGYDFVLPFDVSLQPNETIRIPTGIRWVSDCPYSVLEIYPRSGLGFKYQLGLANTVGVIDMDYCNADNEGHIMIKLVNRGDRVLNLKSGDRFAQGIIKSIMFTTDDDTQENRTGGMGSTGK